MKKIGRDRGNRPVNLLIIISGSLRGIEKECGQKVGFVAFGEGFGVNGCLMVANGWVVIDPEDP